MTPAYSAFLDLLRIVAAGAVFASHAALFRAGPDPALNSWAHDGVIAFFVLSGYLVTYSATERDRGLGRYALARAARIYSVALPALLLTLALDYAGQSIQPQAYRSYQYEQPLLYLPFFLAFASDLWFLTETAFSNVPFWSLCYEVWYYVLFGVVAFMAGRRRIVLAAVVLLVMGPKLWLLLPLWALGSWLFRQHSRSALGVGSARLLALLGIVGLVAVKLAGLDDAIDAWLNAALGGWPARNLRYSRGFLGDYVVGGLIGLTIFAARDAELRGLGLPAIRGALSAAASCTFTLYLLHYPLLLFFSVTLLQDRKSLAGLAVTVVATLAAVVVVAQVTERRKGAYRRAIAFAAALFAAPPLRGRGAGE